MSVWSESRERQLEIMVESGSEVARLKEQIEQECQAFNQALSSYAVTAQHEMINKKYSVLGIYQKELERLIGSEQAFAIVLEAYDHSISR